MSKRSIGLVSGHWTVLLHGGHIQYIREAASRCDRLYAIINNSQQVAKKGLPELFDYKVMEDILRHLGCSQCFLSIDEDESISKTIEKIYLDEKKRISDYHTNDYIEASFYNSGDRASENWNPKEIEVCKKYNIAMVYLPLPKIDSSSKRLKRAAEHFYPDYGVLQSKIKILKGREKDATIAIDKYEAAIRKHRDYPGDDRCHHDDTELYKVLPEGYEPPAMDTAVELENCKKFIECRQNPATEYISPQRRIEELEVSLTNLNIDLEIFRRSYGHAIDCVNKVFHQDGIDPLPILPGFISRGDDKFEGVVKLAEEYKKLKASLDQVIKLCDEKIEAVNSNNDWVRAQVCREIKELLK